MQALQMICLQHYFCKRSNLYPTNCTEFPSRALAENPFHYLPTSLGVDEPLTSSLEVQCSDPHLCYQKTFSLISMKMVTQFSKPFSTMTPEFSLKNKQANQKTSCVWLSKQPCSCGAGGCAGFQSGEETSGGLLRSLTSCYKTYSVTLFLVGTPVNGNSAAGGSQHFPSSHACDQPKNRPWGVGTTDREYQHVLHFNPISS